MFRKVSEDWNKEIKNMLVGENLDTSVHDASKDMLVDFYVTWCSHCKHLSPAWDKLEEKHTNQETIAITKMASADKLEEMEDKCLTLETQDLEFGEELAKENRGITDVLLL